MPERFAKIVLIFLASCLLAPPVFSQTKPPGEPRPSGLTAAPVQKVDFEERIRPIFQKHCISCHSKEKAKGGLDLLNGQKAIQGGNSGPLFVPHDPEKSLIFRLVSGLEPGLEMPPKGPKLSGGDLRAIEDWIRQGGRWPGATDRPVLAQTDWWSFRPLKMPEVPKGLPGAVNAVDAFLGEALAKKHLVFAPEADRRTLLRRLAFDLTGLSPTPEEMSRFLADARPDAYEREVDRLLGSVAHAERWARHWLDLVHYGDTHGFDKDKPRAHAWPYRDYLIRSFLKDKPYGQFLKEQIAGDVLDPNNPEAIEALGFLAAGPWDFIGHAEVPETKLDGKVARHLDRDDMVATTIGTFMSLTAHCAQCHNHKFDPISQEDYYRLQAVFAAIDRADKNYYKDPKIANLVRDSREAKDRLTAELAGLDKEIDKAFPPGIARLKNQLVEIGLRAPGKPSKFGFHTALYSKEGLAKASEPEWIEIDLGKTVPVDRIVLWPCHDEFAQIGAGFGFPLGLKIDLIPSLGSMRGAPLTIFDSAGRDLPNPGFEPMIVPGTQASARAVRIEIPKLRARQGEYMAALAEVEVIGIDGVNHALKIIPKTRSSIEAPERWARANLTDGIRYEAPAALRAEYASAKDALDKASLARFAGELGNRRRQLESQMAQIDERLRQLPPADLVYAGTVHNGSGAFRGTGPDGGKPRPIFVLQRGNIAKPLNEVAPGAIASLGHAPASFSIPPHSGEGTRRAALAQWIAHPGNPLTWRSAVNRIWRHHMGRGIVETPSDFGRMGMSPTHPELLDWLALRLRDQGGSLREIHRLIVTSRAYRQQSIAPASALALDPPNLLFSRFNRRRLDAESYRDSVLLVAGKLNAQPFGPPFRDFVVEKPEHSPHYLYEKSDPDDPATHRRSIYRFIVRSQQHPFLTTLDTADPSQMTDRRNETLGPLQALAMWNNGLVLTMAGHLANRVRKEAGGDARAQTDRLFQLVLLRAPAAAEKDDWSALIKEHGLETACRVALNLGEFVFVE